MKNLPKKQCYFCIIANFVTHQFPLLVILWRTQISQAVFLLQPAARHAYNCVNNRMAVGVSD